MNKLTFFSGLVAVALSACETTSQDAAENNEPDPRQGEEVRQLCFTGSINGWSEGPTRKSIILSKGVRDKYLVTVSGVCDIDDAFMRVGIDTFGNSSCLSQGDKIFTDAPSSIGGPCYVRDIYEWNEDATEETDTESGDDTETE